MLAPYSRILTPAGDAHRFTEVCFALSSGTRLEVLSVLLSAQEPLHIREVARRVTMDPSPVRGHLDVLVKTGFARELPERGRERRFVADVSDVRVVLAPPTRPLGVDQNRAPSKRIRRLTDHMKDVERKMHKLELELAKLADERATLWREADNKDD
ncbi:MAG: helix-turn-helix domain-containing protein [Candidatus Thermoplasmatota archaeon]